MEEQMLKQLQELLDERACEAVLMRYGRTLDWLDQTGQEQCFWPDAEIDYGFFKGSGEEWVPVVMAVEAASERRWHICTGVTVQVQGTNAKSECYGLTVAAAKDDTGVLVDTVFGGRYLDELEKRDGEWRISRRTYIADWTQSFPNGLEALSASGLDLNFLKILQPGHEAYRPLDGTA
ncbi:nuclear transport factor 2 family protein [Halieaceae bacterium IMCC14734]|uniref:Nuclear transport factor 2 family protein n=1 Tax=Candidatus Litorirhabdus singularis TaxID=2518993 RepID=A0ABT3TDZ6_9GAMM|nr:nuclear transport factor 2 family protein [Candidatus Litorirhabdus singularis]MCX2980532.1 nuclear transport factor 2 family protein [Candidatus Litorirhabdus singularis]